MLVEISCGVCGVHFGLAQDRLTKLQQTGDEFYCPKGCRIAYTPGENAKLKEEIEKLKKQIASKDESLTYWIGRNESAEKSLRYMTGIKTRFQNKLRKLTNGCS